MSLSPCYIRLEKLLLLAVQSVSCLYQSCALPVQRCLLGLFELGPIDAVAAWLKQDLQQEHQEALSDKQRKDIVADLDQVVKDTNDVLLQLDALSRVSFLLEDVE